MLIIYADEEHWKYARKPTRGHIFCSFVNRDIKKKNVCQNVYNKRGRSGERAGLRSRSKRVRTPVTLLRSLSVQCPLGKGMDPHPLLSSSQLWVK